MTTGAATTTTQSGLLKIRFQNGLNWRGVKEAKFWNMVSKDTSFTERHKERTVPLTAGNGGSSDFATALAVRGPGSEVTFTLTRKPDYVILSVAEDLFKTKNVAAIKNVVTDQLDRKGWEHGMMITRRTWGENGSALGRLKSASSISTTTFTLESKHQVFNFYPGQTLQFAANAGSSSSDAAARAGTVVVESTSYADATVTCTGNVTTGIPAAADADYVFLKGEHKNSWSGVLGWCPVTAPTVGDSFLGVDRYAAGDIPRLSGNRPTAVRSDKTSNVGQALAEVVPLGVMCNTIFCNPVPYQKWMDELGSNKETITVQSKVAGVNFKGIVIHTPAGDTTVLSEPRIPENVWVGTEMENWEVLSNGEIPSMPGKEEWMREANADARQARLASYACLDCVDPGSVVVGTWS